MVRIRMAALAAALVVLAARGAAAQGGGGGNQMAAMMAGDNTNPMLAGITLTAAQATKAKAVADKHHAALQAAADANTASMGKVRTARQSGDAAASDAAMKAAQPAREKWQAELKSFGDDLRATLTADQQATFDKNREAMAARRGNRGGGQRPPSI